MASIPVAVALWCRRRFLFVSIDAAMASQLLTLKVIERLKVEVGVQRDAMLAAAAAAPLTTAVT